MSIVYLFSDLLVLSLKASLLNILPLSTLQSKLVEFIASNVCPRKTLSVKVQLHNIQYERLVLSFILIRTCEMHLLGFSPLFRREAPLWPQPQHMFALYGDSRNIYVSSFCKQTKKKCVVKYDASYANITREVKHISKVS